MRLIRNVLLVVGPLMSIACEADVIATLTDAAPPEGGGGSTDGAYSPDAALDASEAGPDSGLDDQGGGDAGRERPKLSLSALPVSGAVGTVVTFEVGPGDPGALDELVPERASFNGTEVPLFAIGGARYAAAVPWLPDPSRPIGIRLVDGAGDVATRELVFGYVDADEAWATDPLLQGLTAGELSRRSVERWAAVVSGERTGIAALLADPTVSATTAEALRRADAALELAIAGIEELANLVVFTPAEIERLTGVVPSPADVELGLRLADVIFASSGLAGGPTSPGDRSVSAGYRALYGLDVLEALLLVLDSVAPVAALAAATNPFTIAASALLLKLHTFAGIGLDVMKMVPTNIDIDSGGMARGGRILLEHGELCPNMLSDVDGEATFESKGTIAGGLVSIVVGTRLQVRGRVLQYLRARLPMGVVVASQVLADYVADAIASFSAGPLVQQTFQAAAATRPISIRARVSPGIDMGALFDDVLRQFDLGRVRTVLVNLGAALGGAQGLVSSAAGGVAAVAGDRIVGRGDGSTDVGLVVFFLDEARLGLLMLPRTVSATFPRVTVSVESPCCSAGSERCSGGMSCVCDQTGVGESCAPCPLTGQCDPGGGCLAPARDAGVVDGGASDAAPADAVVPDAAPRDAGVADAAAQDAAPRDAAAPDAAPRDAAAPDAVAPDAMAPDAMAPDAAPRDAAAPDASPPDAGSTMPVLIVQPTPAREAELFQVVGSGFSAAGLARLEYSFDRVAWQPLAPDYPLSNGSFAAGFCAASPGWYRATDLTTLQRSPDAQLVVDRCGGAGERCCTPATNCLSVSTICDGTSSCLNGSCVASTIPETCNGIDDDGNGIVDDPLSCWRTIYRFRNSPGARCLGATTSPPAACTGYTLEREAFILQVSPGVDTQLVRQCSFLTDHIVVPDGSADHMTLLGNGHDCSLVLGYVRTTSPYPATPFAHQCPLRRFSYSPNGAATHIFSTGADNTTGFTCEPPLRGFVSANFPCGGFMPALPGC